MKRQVSDERLRKYHLSSKGIGEDLYYLTESFYRKNGLYKGKHSMSDFITPKAKVFVQNKNMRNNLVFEHMVPKNIYLNEIANKCLNGGIYEDEIFNILNQYYYVCTVTKEEDAVLPSKKMNSEKAPDWDKINPFYRYQLADIEFVINEKENL